MQSKMAQDINKVAEGLVTTVEVSEDVVDSLCAQEWDEGLSMDHHQERCMHMGVEARGWVRRVVEDVGPSFVLCSQNETALALALLFRLRVQLGLAFALLCLEIRKFV